MSFPRYPAYKPSGVEWLGQVPEHWDVKPLKRVAKIQTGLAKGKEVGPEHCVEVPFLRVANVQDGFLDLEQIHTILIPEQSLDRYLLRHGDVLMNEGGDFDKLGRGAIWNGEIEPCIHQNHVFAVRPHSVRPSWLNAYTSSKQANSYFISRSKQSTNLASISSTNLMELLIPVVPDDETTQILDFLDHETAKIDALIAEQQRLIELLQEKRQTVISHAVTKGLNPDAPMKDSGVAWLGEVPEHWEIMGLTKAIGPVVDYRGRTPTKCDSGTLLVTAKNIRNGEIDYSLSEEYVDPVEAEELLQRGRPGLGDVLFTMEAPLGQVALVDREDIALAQRVVKFRGIRDRMTNSYLMWWLVGSHCQYQLNALSTGSTALGIKASKLSAVTCIVPPISEQQAIDARIRDFTAQFSSIHAVALDQIELLQERRSALISAAVTGQIDVRGLAPETSAV